jgi:hypothetical protein
MCSATIQTVVADHVAMSDAEREERSDFIRSLGADLDTPEIAKMTASFRQNNPRQKTFNARAPLPIPTKFSYYQTPPKPVPSLPATRGEVQPPCIAFPAHPTSPARLLTSPTFLPFPQTPPPAPPQVMTQLPFHQLPPRQLPCATPAEVHKIYSVPGNRPRDTTVLLVGLHFEHGLPVCVMRGGVVVRVQLPSLRVLGRQPLSQWWGGTYTKMPQYWKRRRQLANIIAAVGGADAADTIRQGYPSKENDILSAWLALEHRKLTKTQKER